jgi:hypothetical protein
MADGLQECGQVGNGLDGGDQDGGAGRAGLVDDQQAVVEGGPVLGVLAAGDTDVGADVVPGLGLLPPGTKSGPVQSHPVADDGHQATVVRKSQQRLVEMLGAVGGLALALNPTRRRRERRVHDDNRRHGRARQDVVQLLRVLPGHRRVGKEGRQQLPAPRGQLVEDQVGAGELGPNGKVAGAGGRLQHDVVGTDVGDPVRDERQRRRGRELLELVHLLVAAGLGRQTLHQAREVARL